MKYGQQGDGNKIDSGMAVVAKALLVEWMTLAKQMISELPEDQRP